MGYDRTPGLFQWLVAKRATPHHPRRENLLKQAISRQNLERLQADSSGSLFQNFDNQPLPPLRLDVRRAIEYVHEQQGYNAAIEQIIISFSNVRNVMYEELIGETATVMAGILEFPGVNNDPACLQTPVRKATSDQLDLAISNYEELVEAISGTDLELMWRTATST